MPLPSPPTRLWEAPRPWAPSSVFPIAARADVPGDTNGWQLEAACRQFPTDLFFPIGHGPRAQAQTRLAKEVCKACAVRAECLKYALGTNAQYGVFGGMGEEERREVRRRQRARLSLPEASLEASA